MKSFAKSLLLLALLCLSLFALPVQAQSDCFEEAQDAFDNGDYEDAIDLYNCAVDDDPENYEAYVGRANAYLLAGPLNVQSIIDYGFVYNNDIGVIEDVIDDFGDRIDDDPENYEPYLVRAFASYMLGEYDAVVDDTDEIIDLDDEIALAYLLRATANQYLGETRDVEDDLEQAFDLESNNPAMYEIIALAYLQTNEYELAVENYSAAIDEVDDDPYYYSQRGWAEFFAGDPDAALDDFNEAIDLDDLYTSAYFRRSIVEIAIDEQEDAADDLYTYADLLTGGQIDTDTLDAGDSDRFDLERGQVVAYEFEAEEGQTINILVEGRDGVDPLIALIGPDGNGLAANDDRDFEGGDYNSEIADFEAPDDGTYTILIFHSYAVTEGEAEISLEVDG